LLLVAGVFYWNTRVAAARADVEVQREINSGLEQEVASLADAGALLAEFQAKAALVQEALVNDVDWGIFLNDLSRLLPERVWVESFTGNIVEGQGATIVGEVTFSGVGFDFPDLSEWLRTLDSGGFSGIAGPWLSTASESTIGEEAVVSFTSTAVLTTGAVTDRAQELIPEVP
ncbi:MAG: PilN domain-containing protein, partial [Acidimicrobiia bacterium]|nr:PilN domain-containing protein [Acidimicrobiia bacterium]